MKYEMSKVDKTTLDDAYWIGTPAKFENEQNTRLQVETAYFMRSFFLSEKADCTIKLSAHSRYKLYVNGRFVTYGPCKGDRYRRYCDTVDIGKFIITGENTLFLHVVGYPPYEAGDRSKRAGLVDEPCMRSLPDAGRKYNYGKRNSLPDNRSVRLENPFQRRIDPPL